MLDFRFLLGAVVVFVLTVLAGLRIFGATEPLLATMGDQPRVEAVALPRHIPTTLPSVPRASRPDRPFVRPAAIDVPRPAANEIAETIPREPPAPEVTGSVEPVQAQPVEPVQTQPVEPVQAPSVEAAKTQPVEPVQTLSVESALTPEIEEVPMPLPKRRPVAQQRKKEVTGSVAPAQPQATEETPKARPKRQPAAQRNKEPEITNPFSSFFLQFKQQVK